MKKKIDKKSLAILIIGILLVGSSVFVLSSQNQKAKAATNYTIDWTATKYRNAIFGLQNASGAWISSGLIAPQKSTIEIAEWSVQGSVGGKSFTETWGVTEWLDKKYKSAAYSTVFGVSYDVGDLETSNTSAWPPGQMGGLLGSMPFFEHWSRGSVHYIDIDPASAIVDYPRIDISSMPVKWTVSGAIQ